MAPWTHQPNSRNMYGLQQGGPFTPPAAPRMKSQSLLPSSLPMPTRTQHRTSWTEGMNPRPGGALSGLTHHGHAQWASANVEDPASVSVDFGARLAPETCGTSPVDSTQSDGTQSVTTIDSPVLSNLLGLSADTLKQITGDDTTGATQYDRAVSSSAHPFVSADLHGESINMGLGLDITWPMPMALPQVMPTDRSGEYNLGVQPVSTTNLRYPYPTRSECQGLLPVPYQSLPSSLFPGPYALAASIDPCFLPGQRTTPKMVSPAPESPGARTYCGRGPSSMPSPSPSPSPSASPFSPTPMQTPHTRRKSDSATLDRESMKRSRRLDWPNFDDAPLASEQMIKPTKEELQGLSKKDRRRAQNRMAQRAFRARTKVHHQEIAEHIERLEDLQDEQSDRLDHLMNLIGGLQAENTKLKTETFRSAVIDRQSELADRPHSSLSSNGAGPLRG